jgi:SdpC family antimicrobial peptide
VFRAVVIGDGPVAKMMPSIRKHRLLETQVTDPEVLKEARVGFTRLVQLIEQKYPNYLEDFAQDIGSKDVVRIAGAIKRARAITASVGEELVAAGESGIQDKCLIAVVFVAAVNVAVAANHVLVTETVEVLSADPNWEQGGGGGPIGRDDQSVNVQDGQAAADIAANCDIYCEVPVSLAAGGLDWTNTSGAEFW